MYVQDAFQQVAEAYIDAVFNKNVEAFVGLYMADVRIFDMWGVWEFNGIADWRIMVNNWFASLGDERVLVEFDQVQQHVAAGLVAMKPHARCKVYLTKK